MAGGRRGRHRRAAPPGAARSTAAVTWRAHEALGPSPRIEDPVVERLEAWRAHAAKAARVPAQAILDDLTLRAIAEARPDDADALVGVPGLGPVKAARFGDDLLAAVREA